MGGDPERHHLRPLIVVATRSRPREVGILVRLLQHQTLPPGIILVAGSDQSDFGDLTDSMDDQVELRLIVAQEPGASFQRNRALEYLDKGGYFTEGNCFVAFFDDDFRPSEGWLEAAADIFNIHRGVVALTGLVIADGAPRAAISEEKAWELVLDYNQRDQQESFVRPITSLYGCNMAIRCQALAEHRFDESLPLYSWMEDRDITGEIRNMGKIVWVGACTGVHLGVKLGRTSGTRFGYSQIANPLHIASKGNIRIALAVGFAIRALVSNAIQQFMPNRMFDYRGRLRGNLLAVRDLIGNRCRPENILKFQ